MENGAADSKIRYPTVESWSVAANVLKVGDFRAATLRVTQQQNLK